MMKTEILKISGDNRRDRQVFLRAAQVIKKGGVISFPTETVYALGADAMSKDAVQKIFLLKEREPGKPVSIFIRSQDELTGLVELITPPARKLMQTFWPGPLTLIFRSKPGQVGYLAGKEVKLGIRLSSSELVQELLAVAKTPLTATSANLSGAREPVSASEVSETFAGKIELIIDGGVSAESTPSSVVDVSVDLPIILREGRIPFEKLRKAVPELQPGKPYGK